MINMERGITLLEAVVGMALAALLVVVMGSSINQAMHTNTESETRSAAMRAGEMVLESIRGKEITSLPSQPGASEVQRITLPSQKEPFEVTVTYCANVALCSDSLIRQVSVDVRRNDRLWFSAETVFAQMNGS